MMQGELIKISARLLAAWLVLSIIFFMLGEALLAVLLPGFAFVVDLLSNGYSSELLIVQNSEGKLIRITATLTEAVYRHDIPIAPAGTRLTASSNLIHSLVPIVILFSLLFVWPVMHGTHKTVLLILGIPMILIVLALTTPTLLAGHVEGVFQQAAENVAGEKLDKPFIMTWLIFIETGGRWLLPIVGAILCVITARPVFDKVLKPRVSQQESNVTEL